MTIKLTREEAIQDLEAIKSFERYARGRLALDIAIEALKSKSRPFEDCSKCIHTYGTLGCCTTVSNEWVYDCEHGMEQYKNTKAEPSEDGTLEVKVEDATKVGRVLISDDKHRGGLYYPDEDEPQSVSFENDTEIKSCSKDSDLISRAEAIEAIELVDWYHQNKNKDMVHGANSDEHQAWYKAEDVYKALEAVPSADRPKGEWIKRTFGYGECPECGLIVGNRFVSNFCPNCGADMRGDERSKHKMRLIDADALREDMQWAIDHGMYDKPYDYLAEIDDAPTIGEWISVSERMPDDGKWAIWCSNDGIIGIARFKEDCYNHFYPNDASFELEDAVAWMPLPEPYKEGDAK